MGGHTSCILTVLFFAHCSTSLPVGPDIEARARLIKVLKLLSFYVHPSFEGFAVRYVCRSQDPK